MGVEPFLVLLGRSAVLAQRLVRVLCPACREAYDADRPRSCANSGITPHRPARGVLYRAVGCAQCMNTGYRGRTESTSCCAWTTGSARHIMRGSDASTIKEEAMAPRHADPARATACDKMALGITSAEEVLRVTQEEA